MGRGNKEIKKMKTLFAIFAVFLFAGFALAFPAVVIQPKDVQQQGLVEIYPFEKAAYEVIVTNPDAQPYQKLAAVVEVESGLAIVEQATETNSKSFSVDSLAPGQTVKHEVVVKATSPNEKNYTITANYGIERYTNSATTVLVVKKNPLSIETKLKKSDLQPGDEGTIELNFKNTGKDTVKDIVAELILPPDFENKSDRFVLLEVEPQLGFQNKTFKFVVPRNVSGKFDVKLRMSYTDEAKPHELEKTFSVDVQERSKFFALAVVAILIIAAAAYFFTRPKKEVVEAVAKAPKSEKAKEHH